MLREWTRFGRRAAAAVTLVALTALTGLWMLLAVIVSPLHDVLEALGLGLLGSAYAFCLRDAGHWVQLVPAAEGLVAFGFAARRLWRVAAGGAGPRGGLALALTAFVLLLAAWVVVYGYVGDCGIGGDDG